jgi:hypothetical protein
VHGVIAYLPSNVVNPACVGGRAVRAGAWTRDGRELP